MNSFKKSAACLLIMVPAFAASAAAQSELTGCAAKQYDIEKQIDYARTHGNQHRIAGLETALAEVKASCTESGLLAERQEKVREKERKVAERMAELKQAQETGSHDKIMKKEKKLAEAKEELVAAQRALSR